MIDATGDSQRQDLEDADDPCVENLLQVTTTVDQQVIANDGVTTYLYTYTSNIKNVGTASQH